MKHTPPTSQLLPRLRYVKNFTSSPYHEVNPILRHPAERQLNALSCDMQGIPNSKNKPFNWGLMFLSLLVASTAGAASVLCENSDGSLHTPEGETKLSNSQFMTHLLALALAFWFLRHSVQQELKERVQTFGGRLMEEALLIPSVNEIVKKTDINPKNITQIEIINTRYKSSILDSNCVIFEEIAHPFSSNFPQKKTKDGENAEKYERALNEIAHAFCVESDDIKSIVLDSKAMTVKFKNYAPYRNALSMTQDLNIKDDGSGNKIIIVEKGDAMNAFIALLTLRKINPSFNKLSKMYTLSDVYFTGTIMLADSRVLQTYGSSQEGYNEKRRFHELDLDAEEQYSFRDICDCLEAYQQYGFSHIQLHAWDSSTRQHVTKYSGTFDDKKVTPQYVYKDIIKWASENPDLAPIIKKKEIKYLATLFKDGLEKCRAKEHLYVEEKFHYHSYYNGHRYE